MANRANEVRLDIRSRGFWMRQQDAFFDIRVTHTKANLLLSLQAMSQLGVHEREKKRQYAERVNMIDHGTFTPLVFSTTGMVGRDGSRFLKSLVNLITEKNVDLSYIDVMNHLRCKLSFCLLRWNITCLRGCRVSHKRNKGHFSSLSAECWPHIDWCVYH